MKQGTGRKLTKADVAIAGAISGIELAVYIITPIVLGYLVGKGFGNIGTLIGLMSGALIGLILAVRRAMKMAL